MTTPNPYEESAARRVYPTLNGWGGFDYPEPDSIAAFAVAYMDPHGYVRVKFIKSYGGNDYYQFAGAMAKAIEWLTTLDQISIMNLIYSDMKLVALESGVIVTTIIPDEDIVFTDTSDREFTTNLAAVYERKYNITVEKAILYHSRTGQWFDVQGAYTQDEDDAGLRSVDNALTSIYEELTNIAPEAVIKDGADVAEFAAYGGFRHMQEARWERDARETEEEERLYDLEHGIEPEPPATMDEIMAYLREQKEAFIEEERLEDEKLAAEKKLKEAEEKTLREMGLPVNPQKMSEPDKEFIKEFMGFDTVEEWKQFLYGDNPPD